MKILQWNVHSYFARLPILQAIIDKYEPDMICLQETWLKPQKSIKLRGFHEATRKDRPEGKGGGVSVHVRSHIPRTAVAINSELEICAECIYVENKGIGIISLYIPPNYNNTHLLANLTQIVQHLPSSFIISMDSNAHHLSWGSEVSDGRGRIIDEWITDTGLVLLNNSQPTYLHGNGNWTHIDLTVATSDIASSLQWDVLEACSISDHFPILIQSNLNCPENSKPKKWKLRNADWSGFRASLELDLNYNTPTEACKQLEQKIVKAANDNIGWTKETPNPKRTRCWWTPACSDSNYKMKHAYNKYKRHRGNIELWIDFKRARAVFRKTIKEAKLNSWKEFVNKINSNTPATEVWQMVRKLNSTNTQKAITLSVNDTIISHGKEVANKLGERFATVSNGKSSNPIFTTNKQAAEAVPPNFTGGSYGQKYNEEITMQELNYAMKTCKSKSPGPDSIPFEFIKQFSSNQIRQLLLFYNYIWKTGLPEQWRDTTIIPILKQGKPATNPSSYRPVALTNCLCKLLEKIVNRRLQHYLEENKYISPYQSGFRAGHSTIDPLTRLESAIRTSFIRGEICIAIFLDIDRAFDSVWHVGLLKKLNSAGLQGNLPYFVQQFLQSRKISVRVGNQMSEVYPIHSGVPQGSVVSPTLFTIMINDLFNNCAPEIQHSLYADDGAMWYCSHKITEGVTKMQQALETLVEWSNRWGLNMSPQKTKAMIFSRSGTKQSPPLQLNGTNIEYVTAHKFLGVTLDSKLSWGRHVAHIKDTCQSKLRLLRIIASCEWGADLVTLRKIYQALILSKIDYASFLLSTASPTHLLSLDRIQYAAARTIAGALKCTPVRLLEEECQLMTLCNRRNMQMAKYAVRVASIPDHPVRKALTTYRAYEFYDRSPLPLPATGRILKEMEQLEIDFSTIATIPMSARYETRRISTKSTINIAKKQMLVPQTWRALYNHVKTTEYPNRTEIFSDGSLSDGRSAFAFCMDDCNVVGRLQNDTTIYTTELFAILSAIKFATNLPGQYVLWTDSLSSIKALSSTAPADHHLIHKITECMKTMPDDKIVIEWIPSHMGIEGNERADRLAKQALELQQTTLRWLGKIEAYRKINAHYASKNRTQWSRNQLYNSAAYPAEANYEHHSFSRQQQIAVSRLRLRTTKITHGHYFTRSLPRMCRHCSTRLTLKHMLIDCPDLSEYRTEILQQCNSRSLTADLDVLLSNNFPPTLLARYLEKTGYLTEV